MNAKSKASAPGAGESNTWMYMAAAAGLAGIGLIVLVAGSQTETGKAVVKSGKQALDTAKREGQQLVRETRMAIPGLEPESMEAKETPLPDGDRLVSLQMYDASGWPVAPVTLRVPHGIHPPFPTLPLRGSSPYAQRDLDHTGSSKFHDALDLPAADGTPLHNIETGKIVWVSFASPSDTTKPAVGNAITIRGDMSGIHYMYAHLEQFEPWLLEALKAYTPREQEKSGTNSDGSHYLVKYLKYAGLDIPVKAGRVIGRVGHTGNVRGRAGSTGSHLHLKTQLYAERHSTGADSVNPKDLLPASWFTGEPRAARDEIVAREPPAPRPPVESEPTRIDLASPSGPVLTAGFGRGLRRPSSKTTRVPLKPGRVSFL